MVSVYSCYRKHELEKKRAYEQRIIEVEHATFTPIVLSASGGLAKGATIFFKRLATMLTEKWDRTSPTAQLSLETMQAFVYWKKRTPDLEAKHNYWLAQMYPSPSV